MWLWFLKKCTVHDCSSDSSSSSAITDVHTPTNVENDELKICAAIEAAAAAAVVAAVAAATTKGTTKGTVNLLALHTGNIIKWYQPGKIFRYSQRIWSQDVRNMKD